MSVFTTAGDCVSSFGQYGIREGEFSVRGLCIDKDGALFMADFGNQIIQGLKII